MKTNHFVACVLLAPCALASQAHAFDVVEAGQPSLPESPAV